MAKIDIIVGSMLGATEYVADAFEKLLNEQNHQCKVHLQPDLNEIDDQSTWIICTSTHGAGELPDNIQPFAEQLEQANLPSTKYLLIGLGDSSYDTYCYGAMQIQQLMQKSSAKALAEPLLIDVLSHPIPEEKALEWLQQWLENNKF